MREMSVFVGSALWMVVAGCASTTKAAVAGKGVSAGLPSRDVSQKQKAEFANAQKSYIDMAKDGLSPEECAKSSEAFAQVADDNPKLIEARYNQGAVLEQCGDPIGARKIYVRILDGSPSYSMALSGMGRVFWREGDDGRAFEHFRRAVKSDSKNGDAYLGLALVQRGRAKAGDAAAAKEARNNLRRALAVDAYNMEAYAALAQLEYDLAGDDVAKLDMARLVCDQARKLQETFAPIHNVSGLVSLKRDNVTAALAQFKRAAELDSKLLAAYMNIGAITLNFRDYATAEGSFRRVLEAQPQNFDAMIGLGVALRGQRRIQEAEQAYGEAGKMQPGNPAVAYNLGVLYQDYLDAKPDQLSKAKDFLNGFVARSNDTGRVEDAKQRIKNIDDTFKAIEQAKKMQAEMERMQKQMEEQQRKMREIDEEQGAGGGG